MWLTDEPTTILEIDYLRWEPRPEAPSWDD
jgi:hypothetical protein